jgi:hypothetical protein
MEAQPAAAANYGACTAANFEAELRMGRNLRVYNDSITAGDKTKQFDGIYAESPYLRQLHSCTANAGQNWAAYSWAILSMYDPQGFYPQVGYGHTDCPTGSNCAIPDGNWFFYTPSPYSQGSLDQMPGAEQPQTGRRYSFKIEWTTQVSLTFTVRDMTDGQTWSTIDNWPKDLATEVFYGFEVNDSEAQWGGTSSTSVARLDKLEYNRDSSSTWYIETYGAYLDCSSEPYDSYPTNRSCDMEPGEPDPWPGHKAIGDAYTDTHEQFIKAYTNDV